MDILRPTTEEEVRAIVEAALARSEPLEIVGQGSKRGLGRPVEAGVRVDTGALAGVTLYEPTELVLQARPGTPMAEIETLLDTHNQELAFEPMNPAVLWRGNAAGTIGGTVSVNAGGPRRIKSGAARDHLLGFRAVSGRGEIFKSGGQVMKNVTGYDLSKLVAGSFGTLAILTEVTLKVLPRAETERTFLLRGLDEAGALAALREASGLSYETSSFACLPDGSWLDLAPGCLAALRLEGPAVSVDKRFEDLVAHFGPRGRVDDLGAPASRRFWRAMRDAEVVAAVDGPVWKISTAPRNGGAVVAALARAGAAPQRWVYDWAGGLVWLAYEGEDPRARAVRDALKPFGGHATLMRGSEAVRSTNAVFQPMPAPLAALNRRVKAAFDPHDLLNRGRLGL